MEPVLSLHMDVMKKIFYKTLPLFLFSTATILLILCFMATVLKPVKCSAIFFPWMIRTLLRSYSAQSVARLFFFSHCTAASSSRWWTGTGWIIFLPHLFQEISTFLKMKTNRESRRKNNETDSVETASAKLPDLCLLFLSFSFHCQKER